MSNLPKGAQLGRPPKKSKTALWNVSQRQPRNLQRNHQQQRRLSTDHRAYYSRKFRDGAKPLSSDQIEEYYQEPKDQRNMGKGKVKDKKGQRESECSQEKTVTVIEEQTKEDSAAKDTEAQGKGRKNQIKVK